MERRVSKGGDKAEEALFSGEQELRLIGGDNSGSGVEGWARGRYRIRQQAVAPIFWSAA
jgi:hypothetical protein